jgi:uncharacterized protein
MWHLTRSAIQRWAHALLHTRDTPQRTAVAFGLGVTVGFSPFVGLHTLIGLALAFLLRLNRVAVVGGLWVNLPWFLGPYYAATTALGAWLTGTKMPPRFLEQLQAIWNLPAWADRGVGFARLLQPMLVPFLLGSSLGALVLGFFAYRMTLGFLNARKRLDERRLDRQK